MDHVAIMKKSWRLIEKIESGEKIIESRWYKCRRDPWNKISKGDTVYFKNSGEPVVLKASASRVLQFDDLDKTKIATILKKYGNNIGAGGIPHFEESLVDKKYCILIWLSDAMRITPFSINKKGFGAPSAWIVIDNINKIKM